MGAMQHLQAKKTLASMQVKARRSLITVNMGGLDILTCVKVKNTKNDNVATRESFWKYLSGYPLPTPNLKALLPGKVRYL